MTRREMRTLFRPARHILALAEARVGANLRVILLRIRSTIGPSTKNDLKDAPIGRVAKTSGAYREPAALIHYQSAEASDGSEEPQPLATGLGREMADLRLLKVEQGRDGRPSFDVRVTSVATAAAGNIELPIAIHDQGSQEANERAVLHSVLSLSREIEDAVRSSLEGSHRPV